MPPATSQTGLLVGVLVASCITGPIAAAVLRTNGQRTTTVKETPMKPTTVINRLVIKPGKIDEFIEVQRNYAASLMKTPAGLIASRLYRGIDGKTVVIVSQFESLEAFEKIRQQDSFTQNVSRLQALVESSSPGAYEEAFTTGGFQ